MTKTSVAINGKKVDLSNLDKDLYPSYGFTKARIIEYYSLIGPYILPHLRGRALTLKRFPDGVDGEYFFEKRCPAYKPEWVATAAIPYGNRKLLTACLANDLQTLVWVENLASIELHVPLSKASSPSNPDSVVFDLDPGEGAGVLECATVALILKGLFDETGLESVVKTSGKKGLHIFIPLNTKGITYDDTKKFSRAVAETMQNNYPELVTSKMAKDERPGKVFINWSQNDASKTMVCVYSLRAGEKPFVSCPLGWKELKKLSGQKDASGLQFLHSQAVARAKKTGDLFAGLLDKKQRLPI